MIPLSQQKSTRWSITMWLTEDTGYTHDSPEQLRGSLPPQWSIEGQEEKGKESGKLHYQLFLKTPHIRGSSVMKVFPKCHIEVARNSFALEQYVHKEDTRVGEFRTIENKSPQWHYVVEKFMEWFLLQFPDRPIDADISDDTKMKLWDEFITDSIIEGMRIDVIGVNPQYRSCIMKYWRGYITKVHRQISSVGQTDRQTELSENNVSPISIPSICLVESTPASPVQVPVVKPQRVRVVRQVLV